MPVIGISIGQYQFVDEKGWKIKPESRDAYEWWSIHQWYQDGAHQQEWNQERNS